MVGPGPASVHVRFGYPFTLTESGLAGPFTWTVRSQGVYFSSNTSILVLYLTNGTHRFSVQPLSGYSAAPHAGYVTIRGAPSARSVGFTPG